MKHLLYLVAGFIFAIGLSLSGMIDQSKVKGFLSVGFHDWNPALLFVLGSAVPTYAIFYFWLKKRAKTLNGKPFEPLKPGPINSKLVVGSLLFGIGWGIMGLCPGPAIVHLAFFDLQVVVFLCTMFLGFELQKKYFA